MAILLAGLTAITAAEPTPSAAGREQILEAYRTEMTSLDDFHKDNFTLMVHAYNPFMARGFTEQLKENGTYDPKRDINLMKEPERLREKGMVSASIITAEQLPTFGRLLFILAFEPEDILATAPEDGYFIYKKKEMPQAPPGPHPHAKRNGGTDKARGIQRSGASKRESETPGHGDQVHDSARRTHRPNG